MRLRWMMPVVLTAGVLGSWGAVPADDEPGPVDVAEVTLDRPADFRQDVLPILRAKCLACHSASKKEGGLVLESAELIRQGGDSGPAVVAGNPDESLLALAAGRRGDVSAMPPLPNDANAVPVTSQELGLIALWIREGAKDSAVSTRTIHWQPLPSGLHAVYSLALDPQERLVAAGRANQIVLYDIIRQRENAMLRDPMLAGESGPAAHRDIVSSLAFSPDGQWLASGGYRIVKLWQRSTPLVGRRQIEAPANVLAMSADGRWLAAGIEDGSVRLWDRSSSDDGVAFVAHQGALSAMTMVPDGSRLMTTSAAVLRLWETSNQQQSGELLTPSPIRCVKLLPDGRQFATGHEDGIVRIWGIDQVTMYGATPAPETPAAPVKELKGHTGPVTSLAWITAEGPRLVSASEDGTLRQWDVEAGTETRQLAHGSPVSTITAASDGTRIASAGPDGIVRVWDAQGAKVAEFSGDPRPAWELIHRQDEQKVAQARKAIAEKAVTDTENDLKEREESLKKAGEQVAAAEKTVSETQPKVDEAQKKVDETAASLSEMPDDEARKKAKADAESALAKEQEALKKAEDAVVSAKRGVELSESSVAAVKAELEVRKGLRDVEVAAEQAATAAVTEAEEQAKLQASEVRGLVFAPDGSWLAVADADGRIVQWHVETQRALDVFETEPSAGIRSLIDAEGGHLISTSTDGHVDIWRGEATWTLAGHLGPTGEVGLDVGSSLISDRVLSLDFSPDGSMLAVGGGIPSRSGQLQIWDVGGRSLIQEFTDAHSDTVFDVAFSRDGTQLASGSADKFAKVFSVETGELIRSFEGHTGHVLSVAWKADGSVLATGGADNAIKAWTTATGEQQRTITSHRKPVAAVEFVGIEEKLVSAAGDNAVLMHTISNGRNYRRLDGSTDFLHATVVNRDETRVIAGGEDGVVRMWDGTNGKLIASFGVKSE